MEPCTCYPSSQYNVILSHHIVMSPHACFELIPGKLFVRAVGVPLMFLLLSQPCPLQANRLSFRQGKFKRTKRNKRSLRTIFVVCCSSYLNDHGWLVGDSNKVYTTTVCTNVVWLIKFSWYLASGTLHLVYSGLVC